MLRQHAPEDLAGQQRTGEIQIEDGAQGIFRQIEERGPGVGGGGGPVAAGCVDQPEDAAELIQHGRTGLLQRDPVEHVSVDDGCAADPGHVQPLDAMQDAFGEHRIAIEDGDVRAAPDEGARDLAAEEARAAGDDEGAAREVIEPRQFSQVHAPSLPREAFRRLRALARPCRFPRTSSRYLHPCPP